ncbi:MAG: hypothetical protein RIR61_1153, partial [Bacteroidota bacterium]
AAELAAYFTDVEPRGELVVVVEGAKSPAKSDEE